MGDVPGVKFPNLRAGVGGRMHFCPAPQQAKPLPVTQEASPFLNHVDEEMDDFVQTICDTGAEIASFLLSANDFLSSDDCPDALIALGSWTFVLILVICVRIGLIKGYQVYLTSYCHLLTGRSTREMKIDGRASSGSKAKGAESQWKASVDGESSFKENTASSPTS